MSLLEATRKLGWHVKAAALGQLSVDGWDLYFPMDQHEGAKELSMKAFFLNDDSDIQERYDHLFQYFLRGFIEYASPGFERVFYPGMGSFYGYQISGLEGFARTATLMAAWIASGRDPAPIDPETHKPVGLVALLRKGLLMGTDPASNTYWGKITDYDQRTVETADIARVLWLTRKQIWFKFSNSEQKQVADWLLQVNSVSTYENNWLLFPVIVNFSMDALGYKSNTNGVDDSIQNYYKFKKYYIEKGWFSDGQGVVDFYNAWGITYEMFWFHLLMPDFDREFIVDVLTQSAMLTSHLIGPRGVPIMGRSIIYRTAVSVPVLAAGFINPSPAALGLARRAMDAVWRYFVAHGCLRNGSLTQGYFDADPRFLDRYSGPGSSHWGLRSLVLAYMHPRGSAFWTAAEQLLPVEVADYRLDCGKLGWVIEGRKADARIEVRLAKNRQVAVKPRPYSIARQIAEKLVRGPLRPGNYDVKYECAKYSSDNPLNLGSTQ
jgi:hypothetical protein